MSKVYVIMADESIRTEGRDRWIDTTVLGVASTKERAIELIREHADAFDKTEPDETGYHQIVKDGGWRIIYKDAGFHKVTFYSEEHELDKYEEES